MKLRKDFTIRMLRIFAISSFAMLGFAASAASAPPGTLDLKITKTAGANSVREGSKLTYTVTVSNLGPAAATGVTVVDQLPKGADFISAGSTAGKCTHAAKKVTCLLGDVAVDSAAEDTDITVTIVVIPRKSGTITNTATVSADQKDSVKANDKASVKTKVVGRPKKAKCAGVTATIVGTSGRDRLVGTSGRDVVASFGGADRIATFGGRDLVCSGRGNDYVLAGARRDRVLGGPGADRLFGRGGADLLKGNAGNDVLKGNRGNDVLKGNRGHDRLRGGFGFDLCRGGAGADSLFSCER